jgi:uncharacterized protein with HEPN domain
MSRRDPLGYLKDCVDAAKKVITITHGMTLEDYLGDFVRRGAIERYLVNAAEAVWQITKPDPALGKRISNADKIAVFRHILVHRYYDVEPETVWEVASLHVQTLLGEARSVQSELEGS